jgi:hypothetical protein
VKRGKKLLLLLLGLAAAVGAWVLVTKLTPDEEEAETSAAALVSVSADDIITLSWTANDMTINLERLENGWVNADDAAFPVDQEKVSKLLGAVSDAKSNRTLAGVQDFSQYGLDKPAMEIAAGYRNGGRNVFDLGNKNTVTDDYYLRLDGGADVQMVGSELYNAFSVSSDDLIAREKIPAMNTPVEVRVDTGSEKVKLVYFEDSSSVSYSDLFHWFLKTDAGYQVAKAANIESLVDKVAALEWLDVVSYKAEGTELDQYGLDKPAAVLAIDYRASGDGAGEETESFVLELGSYSSDGDCYARLRGSSMVYLIDGETAESIVQMNGADLLSDYICYLNMDELLGLDILLGGETYHIDIDRGGASAVYTLNGKQLDSSTVSAFLNNLKNLKSSGTASEAGEAEGEALGFTFYRDAGKFSEITLRFMNYDSVNYLVDFNAAQTQLAARDVVDGLFSPMKSLLVS